MGHSEVFKWKDGVLIINLMDKNFLVGLFVKNIIELKKWIKEMKELLITILIML